MQKPILQLLLITLCMLVAGACENVVDVDLPPHEARLVFYGFINTQEELPYVSLGHSAGFTADESPTAVPNAEITLLRNGEEIGPFHYLNNEEDPSLYFGDFFIHEDELGIYTLEAVADGYPSIFSSQQIPSIGILEEVEYLGQASHPELGGIVEEFRLYLPDKPDRKNYYSIQALTLDTTVQDYDQIAIASNNILLERGLKRELIFNDEVFDGLDYPFNILLDMSMSEIPDHHILVFRLNSINEDRYLYAKTFRAYKENNGNPFAEPITIHSNIENGFGIFSLEKRFEYIFE